MYFISQFKILNIKYEENKMKYLENELVEMPGRKMMT
jgi:hypothetical protein